MYEASSSRRRWLHRRLIAWSVVFLVSVGAGLYVRGEIQRRMSRYEFQPSIDFRQPGGTLVICGGGPLPDSVRRRFVELAGGAKARIVVIPAAVVETETVEQYRETWTSFGIESADVIDAESRSQADAPEFSKVLESATGVWLGGGTQSWLSGMYRGTLVHRRLKEVLARNGVVGGTSAGAAVMSDIMITSGRDNATLGRGFDLIPGAIIDQHFVRRNRMRRLQGALEQHPDMIGFGVDEGTSLIYQVQSGRFRVLGNSCVVAVVPQSGRNQPMIEFINSGDEFSIEQLREGMPVPANYVDLDSVLFGE